MTVHAFELGDVAEVDGVAERARRFVTEDALRCRQVAEGYGVAEVFILTGGGRERRALIENRVAGVAIVADDLAGGALMLAVVAAEAALRIEVADVVRVRLPVRLHFGKEVGLVNALHFADRPFDGIASARVHVAVV